MTIQSDLPGESSPSTAPPSSEQASSSAPVSSAAEAQAGPSDGDLAQEPTFSTQRKKRRRKRGRGRRNKQPSEPTPVDEPANSYDAISECGSSCTEASSYEETDPLLDRSRARGPRPSELEAGLRHRQRRGNVYRISTTLFIVLLILGTAIAALIVGPIYWGPVPIYNNGTDVFAATLVVISVDGLRADYLDRGYSPTLLRMAREGVRAEYMEPSFPSTTFANHYTLVTGLYPESHGIIGNTFYDAKLNDTFWYTKPSRSWDSKWWGGEPIWVTAVRQKQRAAMHMWPGSSSEIGGYRPTYWDPFDSKVQPKEKAERVLQWLDLPFDDRPQLIGVYVPDVDMAGHTYGPESYEIARSLMRIDDMMRHLYAGLEARNLLDIVNVIVVSDHGMAHTNPDQRIYLDEIIDMDKVFAIHGLPLAGITPKHEQDIQEIYSTLKRASVDKPFQVYLREEVPERFHYRYNERIPPIICVPEVGWIIMTHEYNYDGLGAHGYDNRAREMRASFVAQGPAIRSSNGTQIAGFPNVNLYGLMARILHLVPAINNGSDFWIGSSGILRN